MLILLITHIFIAVSGLVTAAASLYTLSPALIRTTHQLTAGTIITGTVLALTSGSVLKGCLSGLLYLAISISITTTAKHKLAKQEI